MPSRMVGMVGWIRIDLKVDNVLNFIVGESAAYLLSKQNVMVIRTWRCLCNCKELGPVKRLHGLNPHFATRGSTLTSISLLLTCVGGTRANRRWISARSSGRSSTKGNSLPA